MALQCTHTPILARVLYRVIVADTCRVHSEDCTTPFSLGLVVVHPKLYPWPASSSRCSLIPRYQTGADGYLVEESGDNRVRPYQFICMFFGQVVCGVSKSRDWSGLHFRGESDGLAFESWQHSSPLFSSHKNNLSTSLSSTCCLYFRRQRACSFYMYAYHVVPGGKASMVYTFLKEAFHSATISPPCFLMI